MYLPTVVAKPAEIHSAVQSVADLLKPDVQYIRYDAGQDWSGDWAIFFRIVLSDEASSRRLRDVAALVVSILDERIDFSSLGVIPYHNFRSASEQAVLQEPAWMPTGPFQQTWV